MGIKFKSFFFTIATATAFVGFPNVAIANTPQSCRDGYTFMNLGKYQQSIDKTSECLRYGSLSNDSKAIAYHYRASSYYLLYLEEIRGKSFYFEKADKFLFKARDDIEKSIKLDSEGIPRAYCLRGQIYLELSFGDEGFEDLEKGLNMGAPIKLCE